MDQDQMQTQILTGLFFCHLLADYTHLSNAWMLNAKRFGKPLYPIFCHAEVHAILMGVFIKLIGFSWGITIILFAIQSVTHFLIDVWKGRMTDWFPLLQDPANKWHWVLFGTDQFLHAFVIILMSYYAVM
jgi:hypothetical protein